MSVVRLDSLDGSINLSTAYDYPLVFHSPEANALLGMALRNPAEALPVEVMGHIFGWLSRMWPPSAKHPLGWMVLSHVDSQRRDIAISTPTIWSQIYYDLHPELQRMMVARVRDVPIHFIVPAHIHPPLPSLLPGIELLDPETLFNIFSHFQIAHPLQQGTMALVDAMPPIANTEGFVPLAETDSDIDADVGVEESDDESEGEGNDVHVNDDPLPMGTYLIPAQQAAQGELQGGLGGALDHAALTGLSTVPGHIPAGATQDRRKASDDLILDVARRSSLSGLACSARFLLRFLSEPEVLDALHASSTGIYITSVKSLLDLRTLMEPSSASAALLTSRLRRLNIIYSDFSDIVFTFTPFDMWLRLPGLTHLRLSFQTRFPAPECLAALQNLPLLTILELRASRAPQLYLDVGVSPQDQADTVQRAHLPALEELEIEDQASEQGMYLALLSQLQFPSSARVRLHLTDEAGTFLRGVHSRRLSIQHPDIQIMEICFDCKALCIHGWLGERAYQQGEHGAELSIKVVSERSRLRSKRPFMNQESNWFSETLQCLPLQSVSSLRLTLSGDRNVALSDWTWLTQFPSLRELSVDAETSIGGKALHGVLGVCDTRKGIHLGLQDLRLQGYMLRNGVDETLIRWLRCRKASGVPLTRVAIDEPVRAKLQDLRQGWMDRMSQYVEHLECEFGWGR